MATRRTGFRRCGIPMSAVPGRQQPDQLRHRASLATLGFRAVAAGERERHYETTGTHIFPSASTVCSRAGTTTASMTFSNNKLTDTAAGGYSRQRQILRRWLRTAPTTRCMNSGGPACKARSPHLGLLQRPELRRRTLNTFHFGAQHDLFEMKGGMSIVCARRADYSHARFRAMLANCCNRKAASLPSRRSADYPVGGSYGAGSFRCQPQQLGSVRRMVAADDQGLEVTASGRYDYYDKTHSR